MLLLTHMSEAQIVQRRRKAGYGSYPNEGNVGGGIEIETAVGQNWYNPKLQPPRQFINPIQGLNPARAIQMFTAAQVGYFADLQWTYKVLERRNPTLRVLKERRQAAIGRLKWTFRVKEEVRNAVPDWKLGKEYTGSAPLTAETRKLMFLATQQLNALREVYSRVSNMTEALRFLALATFRGFSHLEKHVDDQGNVVRLQPVPQYHWAMQYPLAEWLYNDQAMNTSYGAAIEPKAFVIREVDDPLNEIALILHLRGMMTTKDWDCFCETYGIPSLFAQLPKDAGLADTDPAMQQMQAVIANGRGVLTHGATLGSTASVVSSGTNMPFEPHIRFQIEQLVLAGTGGKLTMLSDATGIGQGATPAHEAVFNEIAEAEGASISEIFHEQMDVPELKRRGFDRPLVEFALELLKPQDRLANAELLGAIAAAGYEVSDEQASELLEMDVTRVQMQEPGDDGGLDEEEDEKDDRKEKAARNRTGAPFYDPPPYYQGMPFADRARQYRRNPKTHFPRPLYEPGADGVPMKNPDETEILARVMYPSNEMTDRVRKGRQSAMLRYQKAFANGLTDDLAGLRTDVESIISIDKPSAVTDRLRILRRNLGSSLKQAVKNGGAVKALETAMTETIRSAVRSPR